MIRRLLERANRRGIGGEGVPVSLSVVTVPGDVIAFAGVHPTAVDGGDALLSLMEQVEHRSSEWASIRFREPLPVTQ